MKTIKIESNGLGNQTRVVDVESGHALKGVTGATWTIDGKDMVATAEVTFGFASIDVEGQAVICMTHPVTGERVTIKRIVFEDDSEFVA